MNNPANCEYLKLCHVNCQSLFAHYDEFYNFFRNTDFHVICMSETWLRSGIGDDMVRFPGYSIFRCDRVGRVGGGVGFYLSDSLRASVLVSSPGFTTARPEYIIAEILFKDSSKLLLAVVYRPPNSGYIGEFFQTFLDLQVNYQHSVIMEDFNADLGRPSFNSQQMSTFVSGSVSRSVCLYSSHQEL